jgi:multiple sugar transport system permease protein
VSLAVLASASGGLPDFASLCAGAMIVSLPTLIVFLIAQRRLSAGLSGTGADA